MKETLIPKKNVLKNYPVSRQLDFKQVRFNQSQLGLVTNEVLRTSSSDAEKLICFGISERTLNDISQKQDHVFGNVFKINDNLQMNVLTNVVEIKIDVVNQIIVFVIKTCLNFYVPAPTEMSNDKLAIVRITYNISAVPSLKNLTSNDQQLQLTFKDAPFTVDGTNIIDLNELANADADLDTPTKFNNFINNEIAPKIRFGQSPYDCVLPPIVKAFPMPDIWNQHEGYLLNYKGDIDGLKYRYVTVGDAQIGYLFLIFNIQSLKYPPPCICRKDGEILGSEQMVEPNPLWSSVGFSRQALVEIARSLIDVSRDFNQDENWKFLHAKLRSHYDIHLAGTNFDIRTNTVTTEVAADAGGSVSAGISAMGIDIDPLEAGLVIDIPSIRIAWIPLVIDDIGYPGRKVIFLVPFVDHMDTPTIRIESPLPTERYSPVERWISSVLLREALKTAISAGLLFSTFLGFFYFIVQEPDQGNIQYDYDHYELFEGESVVIIGELFYQQRPPG